MSAAPGLVDGAWSRLHPLSPVIRLGRGLLSLLVVLGVASQGPGGTSRLWFAVPLLIGTVASIVSWLVTRWRVEGDSLQIESGLLRRQSVRFPLERIQAVDVIAPLEARMFGLAEVRVVIAGRGGEKGALAYLTLERATQLRAELLALAHGVRRDVAAPPSMPVLALDNARFVKATLISGPPLIALAAALSIVLAAVLVPRLTPGAAALLPLLLGLGTVAWRSFNAEFSFALSLAPDGVRITRGLLETRAETIPVGRIQAVRIVQPITWRALGWYRIEVDVARQRRSRRSDRQEASASRALFPVCTLPEMRWLLGQVIPGAVLEPPPGAGAPPRAHWRAPLGATWYAAWIDERYVAARTGRLRPATVLVPLEKVQSTRLGNGPWLRALRLAQVHVDTAGSRWQAAALCRDSDEAQRLCWGVVEGARRQRSAVVTRLR